MCRRVGGGWKGKNGEYQQKGEADGQDFWTRLAQRLLAVCYVGNINLNAMTGERPPSRPPAAADYTRAGLPWFDYYGGDREALEGAVAFAKVKSVARTGAEKKRAATSRKQRR